MERPIDTNLSNLSDISACAAGGSNPPATKSSRLKTAERQGKVVLADFSRLELLDTDFESVAVKDEHSRKWREFPYLGACGAFHERPLHYRNPVRFGSKEHFRHPHGTPLPHNQRRPFSHAHLHTKLSCAEYARSRV
jgi:hypothetical protein